MTRVHPSRFKTYGRERLGPGPILYWMNRDQRVHDNWALIHAHDLALDMDRPLAVCFCLDQDALSAGARHQDFMLQGLRQTARDCLKSGLAFFLLTGDPGEEAASLCQALDAAMLVTDFCPLRQCRKWLDSAMAALDLAVHVVDAHNIVPVWRVSDKQEYAARTIRPKLHRLMPDHLEAFPPRAQRPRPMACPEPDFAHVAKRCSPDPEVFVPEDAPTPGPDAARAALAHFTTHGLPHYAEKRNDPNAMAQSGLSAYLHYGQLAPQRAALQVLKARGANDENAAAFLEELIVRRELCDNFCLHRPDYDSLKAAPAWAAKTLDRHRDDPRPALYDHKQLEKAATHQPLWNAAQMEMVKTGKMHGYMRMYWAKKILEWTRTPEQALASAIALNDRWSLDGRDPNGYVGVLWSVAGLHDRPWKERPVFGQIRYMNANGCRRKFDVKAYVKRWTGSDRTDAPD